MSSNGIRDRVAIVGTGCTPFGERWDKGVDDLLIDAAKDTIASAGVTLDDIDAFWLGTMTSGTSGITLSKPLKIDYKPVTRVENFCATGSEAFRNACYAVASGAYDLAMAIGVEKLKDSGFSGLTGGRPVGAATDAPLPSPAAFSFVAQAYAHRSGPGEAREPRVLQLLHPDGHGQVVGARGDRIAGVAEGLGAGGAEVLEPRHRLVVDLERLGQGHPRHPGGHGAQPERIDIVEGHAGRGNGVLGRVEK